MRPPKEIVVLIVLLLIAMASVLWYVFDRRARMQAAPPVATRSLEPLVPPTPVPAAARATGPAKTPPLPPPVDLTKHDGQTIDFSSGQPVVKETPEDQAALEAGLKDIANATKDVTFDPSKKPVEPPLAPAKP